MTPSLIVCASCGVGTSRVRSRATAEGGRRGAVSLEVTAPGGYHAAGTAHRCCCMVRARPRTHLHRDAPALHARRARRDAQLGVRLGLRRLIRRRLVEEGPHPAACLLCLAQQAVQQPPAFGVRARLGRRSPRRFSRSVRRCHATINTQGSASMSRCHRVAFASPVSDPLARSARPSDGTMKRSDGPGVFAENGQLAPL